MLGFDEWKIKIYRAKQPREEDESQDPRDMHRMLLEDQKEQYARYVALHEPESSNGATATGEEAKVAQRLSQLTKVEVVQPVVQRKNATNKDAKWWRNYRKKPKFCPHCKKQL